jgi:hypothetical protein
VAMDAERSEEQIAPTQTMLERQKAGFEKKGPGTCLRPWPNFQIGL